MNVPERERSQRNVISALLFTAIISPAVAFSGPADVPLKISLATHEQVGYKPDCPSKFGGTTTDTGEGSQLGKVAIVDEDGNIPVENHVTVEGNVELTEPTG